MSIDLANPTPEEKKELLVQSLRAVLLPLAKADIGLDNVDNTADENKPVSAAVADALTQKADKDSPEFVGTVLVPTAEAESDDATAANTEWVKDRITEIPVATNVAAGLMSPTDKFKLNGISEGASANSTDEQLRDRDTHTGTQPISTVSGLQVALDAKANNSVLKPVALSGSVDDLIEGTTNKLFKAADKTQLTTNTSAITSLGNTLSSSVAQLTSDIDNKADKNSPLITGIPKIAGINPRIDFQDTDAAANVQYWSINPTNGGFAIQTREDNGDYKANVVLIDHATGVATFYNPITVSGQGSVETVNRRGVVNGYAALGADGKVPSSQLPASGSYLGNWDANTNTPTVVAATGSNGDEYTVSVAGTQSVTGSSTAFAIGDRLKFTTNGNMWERIPNSQAVSSVNGYTGTITLNKTDVGLANVDNTSDVNKPVSTAQLASINARMLPTDVRDLQINKVTPSIVLNDTGTASSLVRFQRGGFDNFQLGLTTTGNFVLNRHNTATGALIGSTFTVNTSNVLNFVDRPTYGGVSLATVTEVNNADARYRSFLEIGTIANTNGDRFIDFNASPDVDFSARVIRGSGVNGNFEITQLGTGNLILNHLGSGSIELKATNVYSNRLSLRPNSAEGGELVLEKGTGQTALNGHVVIDTVGDLVRFYEGGGAFRQFNFNLINGDLSGPSGQFKKLDGNYGTLPLAAGSSFLFQRNSWSDGNADSIQEYAYRHTATNGWTNVLIRKERVIDGVNAGYIDWGPPISGANFGVAIGSGGLAALVVYDDRHVNFPVRPTFNGSPLATQAEAAAGGGGSGVTSFNGRTGSVAPASGDYSSNLITHAGNNVENWLTLAFNKMQFYSPEEFGLVGDGVTNNSGAWATMQAALPDTGAIIVWPAKDYYFASQITAVKPLHHIGVPNQVTDSNKGTRWSFAAGADLLINKQNGGKYSGLVMRKNATGECVLRWKAATASLEGGSSYIAFQDCYFYGQCTKATIYITNALLITFESCRFYNTYKGGQTRCVWMDGSEFGGGGVRTGDNVDNIEFRNCIATGYKKVSTGDYAARIDGFVLDGKCDSCKFFQCKALWCYYGIHLTKSGPTAQVPNFTRWNQGGFENNYKNGIRLEVGDITTFADMYGSLDIDEDSSTLYGDTDIVLVESSYVGTAEFTACQFRAGKRNAYRLEGGRITITGGQVGNSAIQVTGYSVDILSSINSLIMSGVDCRTLATGVTGQTYAIRNLKGASNVIINGCNLSGYSAGAFQSGGTGTGITGNLT